MNKDLIKFALIGLAAGFCLSAEAAPLSKKDKDKDKEKEKEIAMAKCTRDDKKNGDDNGCGSCKSNCNSCNSSQNNQSNASSQMKGKRRSAAQKVLYGR